MREIIPKEPKNISVALVFFVSFFITIISCLSVIIYFVLRELYPQLFILRLFSSLFFLVISSFLFGILLKGILSELQNQRNQYIPNLKKEVNESTIQNNTK